MSFANGESIGPYRIIEQMGQGGMATVYRAYHASLDRYVAIKALHPAIMEDPSFLARFEREAKVVAKLEHPNIVPIYDYSEHAGRPYLVMKFIEGETLKARLAKGPLSKDEALKIVTAVGAGLAYAHGRGYLHRDIKPSNVLLSPDGGVYLADFGLARIAEAGASTLSGDMLMGTPHYISPEQARGELDLDEGTDIYSFGVVLYELVVGRVPFTADTPFSIIHDHIYTPLPLPKAVNPAVPEAVERVLLKSLAKDRADRFASVEDMVAAFERAMTTGAVGVLESQVVEPDAVPDTHKAARAKIEPVGLVSETEAPVPAQTDVPPEKSRRRWIWIVAGVVMACILLLSFLGALDSASNGQNAPGDESAAQFEDGLPLLDAPAPGDPNAYLESAETFLAEGDPASAYDELVRAAELFLFADDFVQAAEVYREALAISDRPARTQVKLLSGLSQALFLGAPDRRMKPQLSELETQYPELSFIQVAFARAELHAGEPEASMVRLEPLLSGRLDDALAAAVFAEHQWISGDTEGAQETVKALLERRLQFPWLREHLQTLAREFQNP